MVWYPNYSCTLDIWTSSDTGVRTQDFCSSTFYLQVFDVFVIEKHGVYKTYTNLWPVKTYSQQKWVNKNNKKKKIQPILLKWKDKKEKKKI